MPKELCNHVVEILVDNIDLQMEEYWRDLSHLGGDEEIKIRDMTEFLGHMKQFPDSVILKTRLKLDTMQKSVNKLKAEAVDLSKYLRMYVTIPEYKEDMYLIDYKHKLEKLIAGYRHQVRDRKIKLKHLLGWKWRLSHEIAITSRDLQNISLPSEEELNELNNRFCALQDEYDKRVNL